ncbi:unnamed protein product [Symbiodinium necroappetens]|uniref:Uncharacterized protein n=1 Tax=Symbiodinium necroappetens TaxID=1628268 RepID=A0A812RNM6_9DINO|nr:unnamed protein product [Symbiodinium necroappetens]
MDPYASLRGEYSTLDVAREMQRADVQDPFAGNPFRTDAGSDFLGLDLPQQQEHSSAAQRGSRMSPDFLPLGGSMQSIPSPAAMSGLQVHGTSPMAGHMPGNAPPTGLVTQEVSQPFDKSGIMSPQELQSLYQDASDVQIQDPRVLSTKVVDKQEQKVSKVVTGKRQVITVEKVVEIPQVITKETIKRVPKPEIIERIIEAVVQVLMVRALMGQVLMDQVRMGRVLMALVMREVPAASVQVDDKVLQVDVALEVTVVSPADVVLMDMVRAALQAVQVAVSVHAVGLELVDLAVKMVRAVGALTAKVVQVALARVEVAQVETSRASAPLPPVRRSLCREWGPVAVEVVVGLADLVGLAGLVGLVAVAGQEAAEVQEALEVQEEGGLAVDYGGYGGGGIRDALGYDPMQLVGGPGSLEEAMQNLGGSGDSDLPGLPPGVEPGSKEYNDHLHMLEAQGLIEIREEIVEVPQVVVEERVVHVPGRKQIQERLIEVPKVEWVERVEYDDFVEYREVPVDKIIEVPEIEYKIKQVDQTVPQTYIQEHFVDRYKEVPVTQVQETERIEHVPVMVSLGTDGQNRLKFTGHEGAVWEHTWENRLTDGRYTPELHAWLDMGGRFNAGFVVYGDIDVEFHVNLPETEASGLDVLAPSTSESDSHSSARAPQDADNCCVL